MSYQFPKWDQQYKSISGKDDLQRLLKIQQKITKLKNIYTINEYSLALSAKCKKAYCDATIRYRRKNIYEKYLLNLFRVDHRHHKQYIKSVKIQNFLKQAPKDLDFNSLMHLLMKKFDLNQKSAIYWIKKKDYKKKCFSPLLKQLEKYNCQCLYSKYQQKNKDQIFPQYLLVLTQPMKSNYLHYGQYVCIFTIHKIKTQSQNSQYWDILCFFGQNCVKSMIPFGFGIVTEKSKQQYKQVLLKFLTLNPKHPSFIITQLDSFLTLLIAQIKQQKNFKFHHIYNQQNILVNIKQKLYQKNHLLFFKKLINIKKFNQFQKIIQKNYQKLNIIDCKVLFQFLQKSQRFCYSILPDQIIGQEIPSFKIIEFQSKIQQLIKCNIPYAKVVLRIIKFMQHYRLRIPQLKTEMPKVKYNQYPMLKRLCNKLQRQIFDKISQGYCNTSLVKITERAKDQSWFKVLYKSQSYLLILENAHVNTIISNERWRCTCKCRQKVGLPCMHLLKIIFMRFLKIEKYINKRWMVPKEEDIESLNKANKSQ